MISKKWFLLGVIFAIQASADHIPSQVLHALQDIDRAIRDLQLSASLIYPEDASVVAGRIQNQTRQLQQIADDLYTPGPGPGPGPNPISRWYGVNGANCRTYCQSIGMFSGLSYEGAQCASGENRPASAVGSVSFSNGCWPNCSPQYSNNARSVGGYCYKPGQKQDNDRTDVTVGCFCQR